MKRHKRSRQRDRSTYVIVREQPPISPAQLGVLAILWQRRGDRPEMTAAEVRDADGKHAISTVQTHLTRLVAKGFVNRRATGSQDVGKAQWLYRAAIPRETAEDALRKWFRDAYQIRAAA